MNLTLSRAARTYTWLGYIVQHHGALDILPSEQTNLSLGCIAHSCTNMKPLLLLLPSRTLLLTAVLQTQARVAAYGGVSLGDCSYQSCS